MNYKFHFGDLVKINDPDGFYHGAVATVIGCDDFPLTKILGGPACYLIEFSYGGKKGLFSEAILELQTYEPALPFPDPIPFDPFKQYLENPESTRKIMKFFRDILDDEDWKHLGEEGS